MLEQRGLVLGAWTGAEPRQRPVLDADSDEPLGFVRCHGRRGWLRWLGGQTLQVFETEDASLLLTLFRPTGWLRAWQLDDADGRAVASLRGVTVRDANGYCLGVCLAGRDEGGVRYLNPRGVEVGAWAVTPAGVCLRFSPEVTNPFLRMALLAATLVLE